MTLRTWTSDVAANSDAGFDGTPEAGDDLLFTSAHAGQCTINQALNFGVITLEASCGTVLQGAVDFGYTALVIGGGVWTGLATQRQRVYGPITKTAGTITNDVCRFDFKADCVITTNAAFNFHTLNAEANVTIASAFTFYVTLGPTSISTGKSVNIGTGAVLVIDYKAAATIQNNGSFDGAGTLRPKLHDVSKTLTFGIVNCILDLKLYSVAVAGRTITLGGDSVCKSVLIGSDNATNKLTVDQNGKKWSFSSLSVGARGILSSSVAGASIRSSGNITVAANGEWNRANYSLIQIDGSLDLSAGTSTTGTETWIFGGLSKTLKLAAAQTLYNVLCKGSSGLSLSADATIDNVYAYVNPINKATFTLTQTKPEMEYAGMRRSFVRKLSRIPIDNSGLFDEWIQDLGALI